MLSLEARPTDRDREGKVLNVLLTTNTGVSAGQIAARLDWPIAHVIPALRTLVADGKAEVRYSRYRPTGHDSVIRERIDQAERNIAKGVALVGQRDRILKAIAAAPGITSERLASDFSLSLDATDKHLTLLLGRGQITEHAKGYRRDGRVEMAM